MFTQTFTGINSPGYNLPIFSISAASNPAITAPPTGTRKFLSVDWTNTSTRPTLWACEWIHSTQLKKQNQTSVCLQTFYYKFWSHVCFFNGWCNVRAQTSTLDVQDAQSNHWVHYSLSLPAICPSETELQRPVRTTHFTSCIPNIVNNSYKARIFPGTSDLCPECRLAPHLLDCPKQKTSTELCRRVILYFLFHRLFTLQKTCASDNLYVKQYVQ